ncbi:CpaD family pilus assembly protein [Novosphingobium rosa]|uniref:CpaD family pilus assembly protein n=1 Tax=Novosphingobium rosa TaxID=76978 RepID=UPI00082DA55C|nr:CpaD family pilus assembly protein [Novosphingobium rosa]
MRFIPHAATKATAGLALTLGALSLAGCGGTATNRLMVPQHQPVVTHASFSLDLAQGNDGLAPAEKARLSGWFDAMGLRYGDQIAIDDPAANPRTRAAVADLASAKGLMVSTQPPLAQAALEPGTLRIVLTRASATVPGCPDWSANSETNTMNALHPNFGCAVNSNLAAMVANPDDLLHGAHSDSNPVATSNKAIASYRDVKPTGGGGGALPATSSKGN